jgi:hypothetical protein
MELNQDRQSNTMEILDSLLFFCRPTASENTCKRPSPQPTMFFTILINYLRYPKRRWIYPPLIKMDLTCTIQNKIIEYK